MLFLLKLFYNFTHFDCLKILDIQFSMLQVKVLNFGKLKFIHKAKEVKYSLQIRK